MSTSSGSLQESSGAAGPISSWARVASTFASVESSSALMARQFHLRPAVEKTSSGPATSSRSISSKTITARRYGRVRIDWRLGNEQQLAGSFARFERAVRGAGFAERKTLGDVGRELFLLQHAEQRRGSCEQFLACARVRIQGRPGDEQRALGGQCDQ